MKKIKLYILLSLLLIVFFANQVVIHAGYDKPFARSAGESAHPESWQNIFGIYAPILGVTGSDSLFDQSTFKDHGILINIEIADWIIGKDGYALSIDGTDEFVRLRLWDEPDGIVTFFARVKFEETIGSNEMITSADSDDSSLRTFQLRRSTAGKLQFIVFVGDSPITITGDTTLTTNEWWDVMAVNDGTNSHLYVNGVSDATPVSTGVMDNDGSAWAIGARATNIDWSLNVEFLEGEIEFLFAWNRSLAASAISLHINPLAMFKLRPLVFKAPAVAAPTLIQQVIIY